MKLACTSSHRRLALWRPCGITLHAVLQNKSGVCSSSRVTNSTVTKLHGSDNQGRIAVKMYTKSTCSYCERQTHWTFTLFHIVWHFPLCLMPVSIRFCSSTVILPMPLIFRRAYEPNFRGCALYSEAPLKMCVHSWVFFLQFLSAHFQIVSTAWIKFTSASILCNYRYSQFVQITTESVIVCCVLFFWRLICFWRYGEITRMKQNLNQTVRVRASWLNLLMSVNDWFKKFVSWLRVCVKNPSGKECKFQEFMSCV